MLTEDQRNKILEAVSRGMWPDILAAQAVFSMNTGKKEVVDKFNEVMDGFNTSLNETEKATFSEIVRSIFESKLQVFVEEAGKEMTREELEVFLNELKNAK